jgi:ATP-binding cassette subfamily B (MDR/TAP) protein 1
MPLWSLLFGDLVNAFGMPGANLSEEINSLALNFLFLAIGAFVASYLQMGLWMWVGARQARKIRINFLQSVLYQDIQFFDTDSSTGAYFECRLNRLH